MPNATVAYTARVPGRYETLARARHLRDLRLAYPVTGAAPLDADEARATTQHPRGFWFDHGAADHAVAFVERNCKHHKGEWAGLPLLLEEWEQDIVRTVFGWMLPDGTRRFRIAYVELPRKQGKSELAAALGLYLLAADREPGAEVYCTATKKDQAKIVHDTAIAMVRASRRLQRYMQVYRNNISVPRLNAKFEPLGADSDTLDGLNPHGNIVDELHAHRDRRVWDVMDTGMGARRQPLTIAITTAGLYDPESIGYLQHQHAVNVLEGAIEDEAFFAFIACAADDADPFSEETWRTANPNYGVSVKPEYLAAQAAKAQAQPSFLSTFLRLHLNRWTQSKATWLDVQRWNENDLTCTPEEYRAHETALRGRECWAGLDISARADLTALVLVFPEPEDVIRLVCRFWMPKDRIEQRVRQDRVPYDAWERDGWLTATPGETVQLGYVRATLNELAGLYVIRELALDPWGSTELVNQLQADGWAVEPEADARLLVEVRQNLGNLSEPCKRFEELVTGRRVRHGGHPVLRWNVANAAKREDANGNIAPDKKASTQRIDGVSATVTALARVVRIAAPEPGTPWLLFAIDLDGTEPNAEADPFVPTAVPGPYPSLPPGGVR